MDIGSKPIRSLLKEEWDRSKKERGLVQGDIARVLGVSTAQVSRLLSGECQMSESQILKLCRFLELDWRKLDIDVWAGNKPPIQKPSPERVYPRTAKLHRQLEEILDAGGDLANVIRQAVEVASGLIDRPQKVPNHKASSKRGS